MLVVNSASVIGLTYLLPVSLLVTATLPVTLSRVLHHKRVTYETVLGALCAYVLVGLLFAFLYLAVDELRDAPFFAQPGPHQQSEYLYFSFVALTTLGFGDLSPSVGLPQALTVLEALLGPVFLVTLVARLVTLWVRQGEGRGAGDAAQGWGRLGVPLRLRLVRPGDDQPLQFAGRLRVGGVACLGRRDLRHQGMNGANPAPIAAASGPRASFQCAISTVNSTSPARSSRRPPSPRRPRHRSAGSRRTSPPGAARSGAPSPRASCPPRSRGSRRRSPGIGVDATRVAASRDSCTTRYGVPASQPSVRSCARCRRSRAAASPPPRSGRGSQISSSSTRSRSPGTYVCERKPSTPPRAW